MPLFPRARYEIFADDKTKKGTDSANSNLNRLKKNISLAGVASIAAAGIAGLGAITAAGIRIGDELAKTSQKLGLTTEGLAGLRNAARLTGVESNKLDLGLQRMTRRIAEAAHGSGEAQNAIKELGLDARRLSEQSPDEQFKSIAVAMKDVSSQSDRVRLGFKLFDSEGVDLIRTLDIGADGLDAAAREAEKFGTAISSVRTGEIEKASDAMGRVRTAAEGLSTQLAASFAPSMASAANAFADWIAFITNTGIPAFRLLGEQIGIVELNVRALSEDELLVRTITITDRINELQEALARAGGEEALPGGRFNPFGERSDVRFVVEELEKAKTQLDEVNARLALFRRERDRATDPIEEINLGLLPKKREERSDALIEASRRGAAVRRQKEEAEARAREEEIASRQAEREAERRAAELEAVRTFLLTREELEVEAYKRREEIILENMAAGEARDELLLDNARQRAQFLIELERQKEEEITRAVENGTATREQIESLSARKRTQIALGELTKMTAGVATSNRAMFELNKAAAIAEGVLGAREAILGSYKVGAKIGGPVLGAIFAATAAAATAAQLSAIASTSFGSGSTPSVVGSTPTLDGQPVPPASTPNTQPSEAPVINIHVTGNGILLQDELVDVIRTAVNSDAILIPSNSRNAAEIRR